MVRYYSFGPPHTKAIWPQGNVAYLTVKTVGLPHSRIYTALILFTLANFLPLQYSQKLLQPTLGSLRSICQLSFPLTSCCKSVNHRNCSGAHGTAGPFFSEPPRQGEGRKAHAGRNKKKTSALTSQSPRLQQYRQQARFTTPPPPLLQAICKTLFVNICTRFLSPPNLTEPKNKQATRVPHKGIGRSGESGTSSRLSTRS